MLIMMLTSSAALLLASGGFITYELLVFRQTMTQNLTTLATMISGASATALIFDDAPRAHEYLQSLVNERHIASACIYGTNGAPFATYFRNLEFSPADIRNLDAFVSKLKARTDPLSAYLYGHEKLTDKTRGQIDRWNAAPPEPASLRAALVRDLNAAVNESPVYDAMRFKGLPLRPQTQRLLGQNPSGDELVLLNRLLIEDAYPNELRKHARIEDPNALHPPPVQNNGVGQSPGRLYVFHQIFDEREAVGTIYLESDLEDLYSRLKQYAGIVAGLMVASLLAAFALSAGLVRVISGPILHLAETAGIVATQKNYTVRAVKTSEDELGVLIDGFNEMLGQINDRDAALQKAYAGLEKQVEERKRAEERLRAFVVRLEQSNRELENFAHITSHDLREPLRKIQAFGDRLRAKCMDGLGEQGGDYLNRMLDAAGRMSVLIEDLFAFSRVTTKAKPFVAVNLNKIAGEVVSDLEARVEQTGGRVEIGDLPVIDADPTQMRQLLQNLIANALKFRRPGVPPEVKVSARPGTGGPGGQCQLFVADNGIGFDEKYLDRIFIIFQRLHGRNEYEGTGIGLAICRKIVERHGGTITAKSAPGHGATFIINLPLHQIKGETTP